MSADWGRCKSTKLYNFVINGELCRTSLKAMEAAHCSGNSERPPVEFAEVNKSRLTSGLGKPTAPGIGQASSGAGEDQAGAGSVGRGAHS